MAAPDDDRGPLDAADRTGTSGTAPAGSWRGSTSEARDGPTEEKKKPGRLASIVARLGLDPVTIISMVKGSLPPIIGLAMLQSKTVADYYSTLGYLMPIVSVIALAVLPRGKFLMNLFLNALAVGVGSAISVLALWSAVKAREHTTTPGTPGAAPGAYNSSQSVVCAIWLFANIWFANVVRAKLPIFNIPVITYSILVNVAATFGPTLTTPAAARSFIVRLMTAMLTALGVATGVNLLVFPVSSRLVVFKELAGAIGLLRKLVSLQKAYLATHEPEPTPMPDPAAQTETFTEKGDGELHHDSDEPRLTKQEEAAKVLEETGAKMRELAGKLHADLPFAKRDIAWGKLDAKDLAEIYNLFRNVFVPVFGMNTIIDIFKRFSERPDWDSTDDAPEAKDLEKHVWNEVMKQIQEPFEILSVAVDQGLEHAAICLELIPKPLRAAGRRRKSIFSHRDVDLEAAIDPMPGDSGFAHLLEDKIQAFSARKGELLKKWMQQRGIDLDQGTADRPYFQSERDQVQLYIILYMENLMHAAGEAVQDLVDFADEKVNDGTMSRNRLITPTLRRLRKWIVAVFSNDDTSTDQAPDAVEAGPNNIHFGKVYGRKRDPEHLPPETTWERFGNVLRVITKFLGSEESAFGFRVACATMTVGVVAFLKNSQRFFIEQRLVWAMIIISIGMTMTSGQSFFGFLCRLVGTIAAMCLSLAIWYMVDGHPAGVIVLLWLSIFINYYFFIKYPRFIPAILIVIVTQVLILGYELQVLTLGKAISEKTGQPFYPTYLLAPYRVACVAGGSLVAFIWTVFPYPLTDRTWLRRDLSATLYLLANYFGVISSTVKSNVHCTAGDVNTPGTPAHGLFKAGRKIFGKVMLLIPSMSQHSEWQRWEPTVGGKFPREAYEDIIKRSTRIMAYLTLASYTMMHPTRTRLNDRLDIDEEHSRRNHMRGGSLSLHTHSRAGSISSINREWLSALASVLEFLKPTHHTILSNLTLLSNSLLSGQSLPPFLPLPRPYEMTHQLMRIRRAPPVVQDEDDEDDEQDIADSAPIRMVNSRTGRVDDDTTATADHHRYQYRDTQRDRAVANVLDPRNIEQPGYAEFAVLQICTTLVCDDLEGLMRAVSGLVGVVDFSLRFDESESRLDLGGRMGGKRKAH